MERRRPFSFRVPVKLRGRDWKAELRKRCLERIRKSREENLRRCRNEGPQGPKDSRISPDFIPKTLQQLIIDELNNIEDHSYSLPLPADDPLEREHIESQFNTLLNNGTNMTQILQEYDFNFPGSSTRPNLAIENELFEEWSTEECDELILEMELAFQNQMHDQLLNDETEFHFQIENMTPSKEPENEGGFSAPYFPSSTQGSEVLCPICKKKYLVQSFHIIHCECGMFHLDTQQDHLTITHLKRRLEDVIHEHSAASSCTHHLSFHIENHFGISALYANCKTCQFMQLVL